MLGAMLGVDELADLSGDGGKRGGRFNGDRAVWVVSMGGSLSFRYGPIIASDQDLVNRMDFSIVWTFPSYGLFHRMDFSDTC